MGATLRLFGGHVAWRPHHRADLRLAGVVVKVAGEAKVGHLRLALADWRVGLAGEEHVTRLEITMHEIAAVCQMHRFRQRRHQSGRVARRQGLASQPACQRAALYEFKGEERPSVRLADLVDLHDVRMLQPRDGLGLYPEPRPLGWVAIGAGEHLEGDGPLEGQVPRLVDDAHAAPAEYRLHLIAGNLRQVGGGRHGVLVNCRRSTSGDVRAVIQNGPKSRQQRPDLGVDEAEFLPPLPDFREQVGAVAAHLFGRLPRVEHFLEQSEHVRVARHRQSSSRRGCAARRRRRRRWIGDT